MTGLPQGWTETALGDVCELLNGRAYSQPELLSEGKYPVLRVGNLFSRNAWYHSDLELDPDKYIDSGDLIYAWSASFGPRIWQGGKVIYHYHIWKCALQDQAVDKHFLYNLLLWDTAKIKGDHGVGSTMMHVTKSAMEKRQIPLPPLPEQRRIVRKLDTLSARSTTARTHLTAIKKLVERYKMAVLSGSLFRNGTPVKRLGEVLTDIRYGTAAKCSYDPSGTPVLRIPNIQSGRIDRTDLKSAHFAKKEIEQLALKAGDILVIRSNGSPDLVGRVALVTDGETDCLFAGYLIRLRLSASAALPEYVRLCFESDEVRAIIEAASKSTSGVNNINSTQLKEIALPLPTVDEQREIVRRIETAFSKFDRLAAEAAKALKLLGHLDQRILAKAFAGDLVPQDPTDEPAETLLARIRETKADAPKSRRGRK